MTTHHAYCRRVAGAPREMVAYQFRENKRTGGDQMIAAGAVHPYVLNLVAVVVAATA